MEEGWSLVYTFDKLHLAEMAIEMLADINIEAVQINKKDSMYKFGEIEIYVREEDMAKAKSLIKELES
ncbi:MAG: DUF2007 domain-containing protein [Bacteroidales bacterium]|nr:DUF2007 domain-containing protein [Bacteroidales bacterium]